MNKPLDTRRAGRVEQDLRAQDVSLYEVGRALDRAVDVRLCGEVYNRVCAAESPHRAPRGHRCRRAQRVVFVFRYVAQVVEVACISELVEIDHVIIGIIRQKWRMKLEPINPAPPVMKSRIRSPSSAWLAF